MRSVLALGSSWRVQALAGISLIAAEWPALFGAAQSDPIFTLEATRLPWADLLPFLRADVHPPFYYFVAKLWMSLWPGNLPWLRLLSILFAAVAVMACARLLRGAAPDAAPWASAFLAANGCMLVISAFGRMYALLLLLAILAWQASVAALHEAGLRHQLPAALLICLGLLTHHYFVFYLAALALWLFAVHGGGVVRIVPAWAVGALVYAALWGPAAIEQVTGRAQHLAWVQPPKLGQLALAVGAHLLFVLAASPLLVFPLLLRRRRENFTWPKESRCAALAAATAILVPWLVSFWKPIFNLRFTVIAVPFLAVALAPLGRIANGILPWSALLLSVAWSWQSHNDSPCSTAAAARILALQASASDFVIFCRLTRKPVEYHWKDMAAPRQSFPAEIDLHPGYEGRQEEAYLRGEARRLAASLNSRVFVLADTEKPASQILLQALAESGFRPREPLLACPPRKATHLYDRLLVFDPPLRQTGSPSGAPPGRESPRPGPAARAYAPR